MERKLLLSGVTLGACVLAVSIIMSGTPGMISSRSVPTPGTAVAKDSANATVNRSISPASDAATGTDRILVGLGHTAKHPQAAAINAVAPGAARIAKARVVSSHVSYTGTVVVVLSKQVSRADATAIAKAASRMRGVDYAEASLTFHPTGSSVPVGSEAWNRVAIGADNPADSQAGAGVVVGVIDTGIAANPDLPKALLVNAVNGVVGNRTITGTTWPGLTVTATWPAGKSTTIANASGNFALVFDAEAESDTDPEAAQPPQDGTTLTLSVTDVATTTVQVTVDAVASLTVHPSNGTTISGSAEKGATVIATIGDKQVCRVENLSEEAFTCTPQLTLNNGDVVTVTATDAVNNTAHADITIDTIAPAAPTIDPSNGKTIHLTGAEASITPQAFDAETGGTLIEGTWTAADTDGEWTFTPNTALTEDTPTWIRLTDAATNTTSTRVTIDTTAPTAASIDASNGKTIHLTGAEAGITPQAFDAETGGTLIEGTWTAADTDGEWTFTPNTALTEDTPTWIRLTDAATNTTSTRVTIDTTAPTAPTVHASDGEQISGTAEGQSVVTIAYLDADNAAQVATVTAAADGTWSTTLSPRAGDRTTVTATATDAVGNVSKPSAAIRIHYGPPSAPSVAPSNGATVVVSAVLPGDVVTLVDSAGVAVGTCVDNADQTWTCTPDPALGESDEAFVVVTDDSGQSCAPTAVVVDTTAPAVTIETATPTTASGTSNEALASLNVSYVDTTGETRTAAAQITGLTWSATLVDAEVGSTITATATDPSGNHQQATSTVTAPPSEPVSPLPDQESAPAAEPANVGPGIAITGSESSQPASLTSSTNGGTVLPGYNFYGTDSRNATDPGADPNRLYHGTHVAGIIAATGASEIAGVAPGVKILPIRVLGGTNSNGDLAEVADAISWGAGVPAYKEDGTTKTLATSNPYPAKVLNLSLGARSSSCPVAMQKAIDAAVGNGTTVVVSAGNNNSSLTGQSPANCKNVIVVTASTATGTRAWYSNWGVPGSSGAWLVAAPGGGAPGACDLGGDCTGYVMSTTGHIGTVNGFNYDRYSWPMAGTSQAAPHVSAVAAMMLAKNSQLRAHDIADALRSTATTFADGCPSGVCGFGIVNAPTALAHTNASENSGSPDPGLPAPRYPSASVRLYQPSVPRVGSVLTASGAVSYGTASFQWYRNGVAIAHATSARYTLTSADLGKRLRVRVSGIGWNVTYSPSSNTVATGYIASITRPSILGTRQVGKRLRAAKGTWSVATSVYRYRWYRNGKAITGATHSAYRLTRSDRGKRITVRVYVKASGYHSRSRVSASTARIR